MGCASSKESTPRFAIYEIDAEIYTSKAKEIRENISNSDKIPLTVLTDKIYDESLDPKDFIYKGLISEIKIKLPGSVNGQQFIIDNCKGCTLVVCDHCEAVMIDECQNCKIVIGPVSSSVFVRDCISCEVAVLSHQFRCRDSKDCKFLLHCRTRPTIETSRRLLFGCYDFYYAGLSEHMAKANLSFFKNYWFDIYDFTPEANNWQCCESDRSCLKKLVAQSVAHRIENDNTIIFPTTVAVNKEMENKEESYLFVLFCGIYESKILKCITDIINDKVVKLLHSNRAIISQSFSERLGITRISEREECVFLEFSLPEGKDASSIEATVRETGGYLYINQLDIHERFRNYSGIEKFKKSPLIQKFLTQI